MPQIHRYSVFALVVLGAFAVLGTAFANPAPDPCDDFVQPPINVGTGVDLPFVENVGQSAGHVRYQATALGGGSLFFDDAAGATLVLNENDGSPAAVGSLSFLGTSGATVLVPGQALGGTADIRLGNDSRAWYTGLPLLGSLTYSGLYPGVDLTYSGDGRRLDANLTLAPGVDPSVVRLSFGGVVSGTETGGLMVSFVADEGEGLRQITLDPPRANQNGEPVEAAYVLGKGLVGLTVAGAAGVPIDVEITANLGPHVQDYAASKAGNDFVVAGQSASPVLGDSPSTARDVFVARLTSDGSILHATFLGGSGDDSASGVTVDASGRVIVSGTTDSADFAVSERAPKGSLGGASDATVTMLSSNGDVLVSTYLGGEGDDVGHGVAIDGDGAIWVATTSDQPPADLEPAGLDFSTVFLAEAEPSTALTLNVLAAEAVAVEHQLTIQAPLMHDGIPVWVNCNGHILLGTPGVADIVAQGSCDLSTILAGCGNPSSSSDCYEITHASGYDGSANNWGDLALQWKEKASGEPYTPANATLPNASFVAHGSHNPLNASEADSAVFPTDPGGTWQSNWARNFADLAVGATLYHHHWDSPVFADFNDPAMITGVYWKKNSGDSVIDICDMANTSVGNTDNTIDVVDAICTDFGNLTSANPLATVCHVRSNEWVGSGLLEGLFTNGVLFDYGFRTAPGYLGNISGQPDDQNAYVGDPPEDEPRMTEVTREVGARLRETVYTITEVERVDYVAGQAVQAMPCEQAVRAVDLAVAPAR